MNLWNETKSVPISRSMVWAAYKKVKANKGSGGVDEISMAEYDANRSKHLYKLWNRMASGSYFSPPVKEVEIPKKDGKVRKLGIPTISDRVGQMVVQTKSGELIQKVGKGTPQGGVISPLLANLFLHYAMDKWLEQTHSTVKYERYADDAILHCNIKVQADYVLNNLEKRMQKCGLELHPEKTKIVYCKDYRRQRTYTNVKFDFLDYSFQPRSTVTKGKGELFLGFDCAISISSKKHIVDKMRDLEIPKLTHKSIVGVAQFLEPYIRGWINYYGRFRRSMLNPIFQLLNRKLVQWVRRRYKRYKTSINRAYDWLQRIRKQFPSLFYQWQLGFY